MTTVSTSQVRQNYHQDSEAAASYVYLSMSYYFDRDDVALKNFAKYFLHQSHEEREHAEKLVKLQNQGGGRIFLQDPPPTVLTGASPSGAVRRGPTPEW
uniref:Ferritin n=1 Tax=Mandrillus leucophaeus TaxID=9568 RepID=A0A2K5Z4D5_MANLE